MTGRRIDLSPYWRIVPAEREPIDGDANGATIVRIADGPGFGNGSHETTEMCLLALGVFLRSTPRAPSMLDFGSGSGILAIAAALHGARVEAIEIDPRALEHARHNAELNGVHESIALLSHLSEPAPRFDLVIANILCGVLIEYAAALCERLAPSATLVLSGLVATDVPSVIARYSPLLAARRPNVYERGTWRTLVFTRS